MAWDLTRVQCASPQVGGSAGQDVTVEAVGPQVITFVPLASVPTKHGAVLTAAASYVVHAKLAGVQIAGWPQVLHVVSAASEPSRCRFLSNHIFMVHKILHQQLSGRDTLCSPEPCPCLTCRCSLKGEALHGFVVGQPVNLTLHTQDRFGNSRAAGGEDIDVELSGQAGMQLRPRPLTLEAVALKCELFDLSCLGHHR